MILIHFVSYVKVIYTNSHRVKVLKYLKLNAIKGPICTKKKKKQKRKLFLSLNPNLSKFL